MPVKKKQALLHEFYFQIDKSINYDSLELFIKDTYKFAGYIFDQETTIRKLLLKYPTAFFTSFIHDKNELTFRKKIKNDFCFVAYKDFDNLFSCKCFSDTLVCFDVILTKENLRTPLSIIDQLQEYFLFSAKHPEYPVAVRTDFENSKNFMVFFILMNRLGISNFILKYKADKRNNIVDTFKKVSAVKRSRSDDVPDKKKLDILRKKVDQLDNKLIKTLAERKDIIKKMSKIKNKNNLIFFDPVRWGEIIDSRKETAIKNNIDEELIEKIFEAIHLNNLKLMLREED